MPELALHAVILAALLVPAFPATFLSGEVILPADIYLACPPWKAYAPESYEGPKNTYLFDAVTFFHTQYVLCKKELSNGELPLWNPYMYSGVPLMANFQSAVLYPPRLLHQILDVPVATTLFILLRLWLCGLTMYVYTRMAGMRRGPARFASIAWMVSTYNLLWCYWPVLDASVWAPILLFGADQLLAGRYRRGFCATAMAGTAAVLAGHPESVFTVNLGVCCYFALRLVADGVSGAYKHRYSRLLRAPALLAAAWAAVLAVCAFQLLPFLEYLPHSFELPGRESISMAALSVHRLPLLACLWVPRFFGTNAEGNCWTPNGNCIHAMMNYPGMAVWVGLALLFARRALPRSKRRQALCLLGVAALFACLAWGAPTISQIHQLPFFRSVMGVYYIFFTMLAFPILGAWGLQNWLGRHRRLREMGWTLPVLALGAGVVWGVYQFHESLMRTMGHLPYLHGYLVAAAGFAMIAAGAALLWVYVPRRGLIAGVFIGLSVFEHLYVAQSLLVTTPLDYTRTETRLVPYLKAKTHPCRIGTSMGGVPDTLMAQQGIEEQFGYEGIYPGRIREFYRELGLDLWKSMEPVCGVAYYLNDPAYAEPLMPEQVFGQLELEAEMDGLQVYRNPRALPRAFLVGNAEVVPDWDRMLDMMKNPSFDPTEKVLVEAPVEPALPEGAAGPCGSASFLEWDATRMLIQAEATRDCVLVVSDTYFPGWKARVGGESAGIFPVFHAFRGIRLTPGSHVVELYMAPSSVKWGFTVSVAALTVSLLACVFALTKRPRSGRGHA